MLKKKNQFRHEHTMIQTVYLNEIISDYLCNYKFKVNPFLFINFFREDINYENFINKKRSAKIIKFILNNSVVNYDIITKDFISRLLHPSGASYILFKINYKVKNQFFNRFELIKKKRISLFDVNSFFSSVSSIIRGAFIFYYKKRFGGIKPLGFFSLSNRFNRRIRKLSLLFYIKRLIERKKHSFYIPWQIQSNLRLKEYFWVRRKINFALINYRNKYLFKKLLSNFYLHKYKKLKTLKSFQFSYIYVNTMFFFEYQFKKSYKRTILKILNETNWKKFFL